MTAFLLVIPWLAVRHVVPALAGGDGAVRAAHTAFGEKDGAARAVYDLLTVAVILVPLILTVRAKGVLLTMGTTLYAAASRSRGRQPGTSAARVLTASLTAGSSASRATRCTSPTCSCFSA